MREDWDVYLQHGFVMDPVLNSNQSRWRWEDMAGSRCSNNPLRILAVVFRVDWKLLPRISTESHEPTPGTHSSSMIKTGAEEWAEKQKSTESSKLKGKVSNGENMSGCGPCQSSVSWQTERFITSASKFFMWLNIDSTLSIGTDSFILGVYFGVGVFVSGCKYHPSSSSSSSPSPLAVSYLFFSSTSVATCFSFCVWFDLKQERLHLFL